MTMTIFLGPFKAHHPATPGRTARARPVRRGGLPETNLRRHVFHLSLLAAALGLPAASQAVDWGPFSLTGFAKAEITRTSNTCDPRPGDCQLAKKDSFYEGKEKKWADELVQGSTYKTTESHTTLIQPS